MSHRTVRLERSGVAIHSTSSEKIIVNYPGYNGDIDGWENKYITLGDYIQERNLSSFVRTSNLDLMYLNFGQSTRNNLRQVVDYSIENSEEICGSADPEMYLMGFSAGAGAIAAIAHEFDQVRKILLMAPAGNAGRKAITKGLQKFTGEVYISVGKNDLVVGPNSGQVFYDMATSASLRKLVMIPNCDHQFRGEVNGKIMSKAPFWAFAGDKTFPSPKGGIKLYD